MIACEARTESTDTMPTDIFDAAMWQAEVEERLGRIQNRTIRVCLLEAYRALLYPGQAFAAEHKINAYANNLTAVNKSMDKLHKSERAGFIEQDASQELMEHLKGFQDRRLVHIQNVMTDTSKNDRDRVSAIKAILGIQGRCIADDDLYTRA